MAGIDRFNVLVFWLVLGGLRSVTFFDFNDPFGAGRDGCAEETAENVLANSSPAFEGLFDRIFCEELDCQERKNCNEFIIVIPVIGVHYY